MKLSIVTTLYRSAGFIDEFYRRASEAAAKITADYEIVMVDDGSPDNSLDVALGLLQRDPRVRVVELSRNFGHHKALMTGLQHAMGELVFLIDSDLEEQPELIGRFHSEMAQGDWDVVFGYQQKRAGGLIRNHGGRLGWYLIDLLYSAKIPRNHCTVRLMRREYVDALLLHRESSVVIGGLWVITGFRQTGLAITKDHREHSSYTPVGRLAAFVNGVTAFSTTPLVLMALMGTFISFASFVLGLAVIAAKLINGSAVGWASIMVSIWFIGGIIVSCLGIIGIYISKIFIETKNRPYVIVRRIHQNDGVSTLEKAAAAKTALM